MEIDARINEILSRVCTGMTTRDDADELKQYIVGLLDQIDALERLEVDFTSDLNRAIHIDDHGF